MINYEFYLCVDSKINKTYPVEECVRQAILGGVTFVQIREKNKDTKEFLEIAKRVKKVTDQYNIPLVINDRIDIAVAIDADGVHLGQNDISCTIARKILGNDKIIGISVTTLKEAKKAMKDGADYIGVGAMFKSHTKPDAVIVDAKEFLKIEENISIPIVVIGGINSETIPLFKNHKISGYAMIRPILEKNDIYENTKRLSKIIKENK